MDLMDTTNSPSPAPSPATHTPPAQSQSRKRKRPPAKATSPAPSDGNNGSVPPNEVLSSRADLSFRPRLSVSRGLNFQPIAEGSEYYRSDTIGVNRIGYRYTPAGINGPGHVLPCRTIESSPQTYRISWEDRSTFVAVTQDGLGLLGSTGFRSARCNAPIREGSWYMEVKVLSGGGQHASGEGKREGSHVRLGWGRREAPLNGPVGLDGYSYGIRDKTGEKVALSRPRPYGRPYGSGDVIGMYISLPPKRQANPKNHHDPARLKRERIAIDLKGQEMFESLEYTQSKEMSVLMDYSGKSTNSSSIAASKKVASGKLPERGPKSTPKANTGNLRPLPTLAGSRIAFFINGECQGTAFEELYDYLQLEQTSVSRKNQARRRVREGVKEHTENPFDDGTLGYYPFISLFNEASVRLNPGPNFAFPPPRDIDAMLSGQTEAADEQTWRPICERYPEFMEEQWELDKLDEAEAVIEAEKMAIAEQVQNEKRTQRQKKRQQAEVRKRVKLSETPMPEDSSVFLNPQPTPQPSPLRHETAFVIEAGLNNPSPLRQHSVPGDADGVQVDDDPAQIEVVR